MTLSALEVGDWGLSFVQQFTNDAALNAQLRESQVALSLAGTITGVFAALLSMPNSARVEANIEYVGEIAGRSGIPAGLPGTPATPKGKGPQVPEIPKIPRMTLNPLRTWTTAFLIQVSTSKSRISFKKVYHIYPLHLERGRLRRLRKASERLRNLAGQDLVLLLGPFQVNYCLFQ